MKNIYLKFLSALIFFFVSQTTSAQNVEKLYNKGLALIDVSENGKNTIKDINKSIGYFNKAISKAPNDFRGYTYRSIAYLLLGNYNMAQQDLDKVLLIQPTNGPAYNMRGAIYIEQGKFDKALQDFEKAISYNVVDVEVFYSASTAAYELEQYDKSIQYSNEAIEMDNKSFDAYFLRGKGHLQLKYYDEAIEDYTKSLQIFPNAAAYNSRGMVYTITGEYQKAINDFEKSIELEPEFSYAYNNLANCYFSMGKPTKACEYWNKAIKKGYEYDAKWKKMYGIDDPQELIKLHCK